MSASVSAHRRHINRCEALMKEVRNSTGKIDSWRCQLVNGHTGAHQSTSGHRMWEGGATTWNTKGRTLPPPSVLSDYHA